VTQPADALDLPWVIFVTADRSKSVIIVKPDFRSAMPVGAKRLGVALEAVDYAPVLEGETAKQAKARVAAAIGSSE
jgi:hypothetical protein